MASLSSFGNLSAKHIDDSVHVCDCCDRANLKATVLMVDNETGAEFNFGRVCAARNSGKTSQQLNRELREERFNATCRAGNQLFSLRRQGTFLTKSTVITVCNEQKVHAEDLPMMIRTWAK